MTTARAHFWSKIRAYFLTGIVLTAPVGITIYLAWAFVTMVDDLVTPFIPARFNPETYLSFSLPGFGLIILAIVLTLLGALTANFVGRALISLSETLFARTPIIRGVYSALKQIFETVISSNSTSFKDVVLIEYPRRGLYAVAFVTSEAKSEIHDKTGADLVNVFVPTTPNPTSGFLLFVPRDEMIPLDMSVDDGLKYIVSVGLVAPPSRPPTYPD